MIQDERGRGGSFGERDYYCGGDVVRNDLYTGVKRISLLDMYRFATVTISFAASPGP
jgi:hypothetical protein